MARNVTRDTAERREQNYLAALNAERDQWVKLYGRAGWQAELNRRRALRTERARARRKGATPLPAPDPEPPPQLTLDDLGGAA